MAFIKDQCDIEKQTLVGSSASEEIRVKLIVEGLNFNIAAKHHDHRTHCVRRISISFEDNRTREDDYDFASSIEVTCWGYECKANGDRDKRKDEYTRIFVPFEERYRLALRVAKEATNHPTAYDYSQLVKELHQHNTEMGWV